jgi:putative transposase
LIRYSESFKLQVVREMEEGRHSNCHAAQEAYGIRGNGTVHRWARQYGREALIGRVIRVETTEERNEMRRLKERVRELERALGDATLDLRLEREYVKIACRRAGIEDVDGFKKKEHGKLSTE